MWRKLLQSIDPEGWSLPPASLSEIAETETALNMRFPEELKALLMEQNGVGNEPVVHSVKDIRELNEVMRLNKGGLDDSYLPFDDLLLFGEAGNGDLFYYPITNGVVDKPDIFVWDHDDDSRTWVAPNLETFLVGWLNGTISV